MPEQIDVTPKKDGGILKEVIREGEGDNTPPPGCTVKVHYTGTFLDGNKFDSSRDRNEPFEFELGKGSVIKGWDLGVATMKKGEQAILTCAPEYAYGESGSPPTIPPKSTLKFDVEVIDWKCEDLSPNKDGGIQRLQIIKDGDGFTNPNDGALVEVDIIGTFEKKQFDQRSVSFTVGEASEANVIEGIDLVLEQMKKGETSKFLFKPKYAFGAQGNELFGIPPNASVEYTITLKSFEKAQDSWALDPKERIEHAKLFKERGTKYFKESKFELAIKNYKKIQSFLDTDKDVQDDNTEERNALLLASYLNLSLVYLKQKEYFEARSAASLALEFEPKNEKALFRRGQALLGMNEPKLASEDFTECLSIDPNNKAAQSQLSICNKTLKEILQKEKKIYANMFDKFARMDTQREEIENKKLPNVLSSVGEWGQEDREREPSEFEKENPNILMLNGSGEFKDM